jgi:ribokinase
MVSAVGRDALADGALTLLRSAQVDLSRVVETDASTGCAAIAVDAAGNNAIAVGSGANLLVHAAQVEDALLTPETTLVLQMEVPPEENAALILRAKARGARIVLNLAPAALLAEAALRSVDLLVVNETEADWAAARSGCGADAQSLQAALGVGVIRTLGGDGLEVATTSGVHRIPARTITPVDSTAAGDCFVGVLAAALDRGAGLEDALRRATTAAAVCCTRAGSQSSIPTAAETDAFG